MLTGAAGCDGRTCACSRRPSRVVIGAEDFRAGLYFASDDALATTSLFAASCEISSHEYRASAVVVTEGSEALGWPRYEGDLAIA